MKLSNGKWSAHHHVVLPQVVVLAITSALLVSACGKLSKNRGNHDQVASGGDGDGNDSSPETTALGGDGDASLLIDDVRPDDSDSDGDDGKCRREVTLEGVALTTPPPFDVVIIADNSESLSWSREDLAQGLSDLVANVHGHAVRISVLTPTQFGESSATAIDMKTGEPLVNWRDPLSLDPYTSPMAKYVTTCTDDEGNELVCPDYPPPPLRFELEGEWQFLMPEPIAELRSDMSPDELEAERLKVVDAVLGLGINGSPEERPLCTLTRYMQQHEARLPERAVFLIIADEDDTSSAGECHGEYEFRHQPSSTAVRDYSCTDCRFSQFYMHRDAASSRLNFSCAVEDDLGELAPEDTWKKKAVNHGFKDTCEELHTGDCTTEQVERAARECPMDHKVVNCTSACAEGNNSASCSITTTDPGVDYCNEPFVHREESYDNLLDYCNRLVDYDDWGSCSRTGFDSESSGIWSGFGDIRPVIAEQTSSAMIRRFHEDATVAFGEENYFVESIVFTPDGPCTPESGQSYATLLMTLASSPEQVHPICESYAPALMHIDQFAQTLLETEYLVELNERESIESITVESLYGTLRDLAVDDYQYDPATGRLQINQGALHSSDKDLSVEVVDPCVPVVR